jgi:tRNA-modifying protein YgfZ
MLIDLTSRAKFRVVGEDRLRFLNGQLTNDLRQLRTGETIYACALTAKGKLSGDLFVAAAGDGFLLDWERVLREDLAARLERYIIADDVTLEDLTDQFGLLHLLDQAVPGEMPREVNVVQSNRFGELGRDLYFPVRLMAKLLSRMGAEPLTSDQLEEFRIERGIPKWGLELTENVIPVEAGLDDRAISYTKGCYLGQEIISRIKSLGHVNRHLRGLRLLKGERIPKGAQMASSDGKIVGKVTSSCLSRRIGAWIGLGFVRRSSDTPGTRLELKHNSDLLGTVEVSSLPLTQ